VGGVHLWECHTGRRRGCDGQREPVGGGIPSCLQIARASRQSISLCRGTAVERSASKPHQLWRAFAQLACSVGGEVPFEVAAFQAAIVSSSGSLLRTGSLSACG
jgi:hypothetical protein